METYTKVFHSMLHSTIWQESNETRLVWITMMLMADENGEVHASIPGLSDAAKVTITAVKVAIEKFQSADEYSRTPDNDGKRIEEIHGGWRLLNFAYFRKLSGECDVKEKAALRQRNKRERDCHTLSRSVTPVTTLDVDKTQIQMKQPQQLPSSKPPTTAVSTASASNGNNSQYEAIYQAYPRHVGKEAAIKSIQKVLRAAGMTSESLLAKTHAFARSKFGSSKSQYIPHPASWFNAGRYDDDPAEWNRNPDEKPGEKDWSTESYDDAADRIIDEIRAQQKASGQA